MEKFIVVTRAVEQSRDLKERLEKAWRKSPSAFPR